MVAPDPETTANNKSMDEGGATEDVPKRANGVANAVDGINEGQAEYSGSNEEMVDKRQSSNDISPTLKAHEIPTETKNKVKKISKSEEFEEMCLMAMTDPAACASGLAQLVKGDLDAMVEFANVCTRGLVGLVGSKKQMKAVAGHLLDAVLAKNENHVLALCAKGEWYLPKDYVGCEDNNTPMWMLEEAYQYFLRADNLGSREGRFLRGRWLVVMTHHHKSNTKSRQGHSFVEQAAEAGLARAYVFLAQCLEFAGKRGWGLREKLLDKKLVVRYYRKAAELGDGDALNDMGSCYATGYGGLPHDFDAAASYYVKAIEAGCLTAFDNLGTHYELGMSGKALERVDFAKAMYYYRQGARLRCSRCACNIAAAYEEGMGDLIAKNPVKAERYYKYCILLAEDESNALMASRALKDLVGLYIARIKLNSGRSWCVDATKTKLREWLGERMMVGTLSEVDSCLEEAVRKGDANRCIALLGGCNGELVYEAACVVFRDAVKAVREKGEVGVECRERIRHMFGTCAKEVIANVVREGRAKRSRISRD